MSYISGPIEDLIAAGQSVASKLPLPPGVNIPGLTPAPAAPTAPLATPETKILGLSLPVFAVGVVAVGLVGYAAWSSR